MIHSRPLAPLVRVSRLHVPLIQIPIEDNKLLRNYLCQQRTPQGKNLCVHSNFPSLSSVTLLCCHGDIVTHTC